MAASSSSLAFKQGWENARSLPYICCQFCRCRVVFLYSLIPACRPERSSRLPSFHSWWYSRVSLSMPFLCPFYRSIPTSNWVFFRNFFSLYICMSACICMIHDYIYPSCLFYSCEVPSGYPAQLQIVKQTPLMVTFRWNELECFEMNGPITGYHYRVYYFHHFYNEGKVNWSTTMITLFYGNIQSFSVAAANEAGIGSYSPPLEVPYIHEGIKYVHECYNLKITSTFMHFAIGTQSVNELDQFPPVNSGMCNVIQNFFLC